MLVDRDQKFAKDNYTQHISNRKNVLITGDHHSGKSYILGRLHTDAGRIWSSRTATPLFISASEKLTSWSDGKHLAQWWKARKPEVEGEENPPWSKLKAHEKERLLPLYLEETRAVLFLDDAHMLTTGSTKGKVAQRCVRAAEISVVATSDENRLFPGLRADINKRKPQIIRLNTEVAYDYSKQALWVLVAFLVVIDFPQAAMILGGLNVALLSRRSTKQN